MSLEFNGAWDHGLIVDSGYYDEEHDDVPLCQKCSRELLPHEDKSGICGQCIIDEDDEES